MSAMVALPSWFFYAALILLGLVVGSFLNVVIVRLPHMMEARWKADAAEILDQPPASQETAYNLAVPRSSCPHCGTQLRAIDNLPVISFLILRGRCAHCRAGISWQYPAVELIAAAMALLVGMRFGASIVLPFALVLSWTLLALAAIDWKTQLLPDSITLPLLWLGLLASLGAPLTIAVTPTDAIIGAAGGYLILWLVFQAFLLLTGKEGMGYGDFKLLAAIGAWVGWQQLPLVLLMASVAGALVGGLLMITGRIERGRAIPFGPWLALSGWLTLLAGDTILHAYLTLSGLQ
ncbi:MAG: A24 family peptidase [Salinisphaera sp.]|jgi:leader peptidase (prepilin peptidase)/N-methyltransferase|nr:A24 family peptidase [Salinisphaera sp.]